MLTARKRTAALLILIVLSLCLTSCCKHNWKEADCFSPKTCTECGEIQGDIVHSWVEATCTTPKMCTLCNKTEGDVVHKFKTLKCEEPMICDICGLSGNIAEHLWVDATCTTDAYCELCSEISEPATGHTTRYGICQKCDKDINDVVYKNGFAVVTYTDTQWMQEKDNFTDIYLVGRIIQISKTNDITLEDSEGKYWTVDVGTACDLTSYVGTDCEVYGFSTGGISSQHKTPLINMNHDDNKIVFLDGKELYPEDFESTKQFKDKYFATTEVKVWIPTDGGKKYHSTATCSKMYNPNQVKLSEAESAGFSRCEKCT